MARTKLTARKWVGFRLVQHINSGTSLSPKKFPPVPTGVEKKKRRKKAPKIGKRKKKKAKKAVRKYEVERVVRMLDNEGERYYEVKWKGYSEIDNTVEPRQSLMLDIPNLVRAYEKDNDCVFKVRKINL